MCEIIDKGLIKEYKDRIIEVDLRKECPVCGKGRMRLYTYPTAYNKCTGTCVECGFEICGFSSYVVNVSERWLLEKRIGGSGK